MCSYYTRVCVDRSVFSIHRTPTEVSRQDGQGPEDLAGTPNFYCVRLLAKLLKKKEDQPTSEGTQQIIGTYVEAPIDNLQRRLR
jgi:hypothetical protein